MGAGAFVIQMLLFGLGLGLLTFGAESLVRGAARLARRLGVSSFIVGLTVVAFGTSAPELGGSIQAAFQGNGDLAIGNVLGSNIANICLILGITAMINPIPVQLGVVRREVPLMILVSAFGALALLGSEVGRVSGLLLTIGLGLYIFRAYRVGKSETGDDLAAAAAKELAEEVAADKTHPIWKDLLLVLIGLVCLVIGSKLLVDSAVTIAGALGVPSVVIGLTMVAFGTSVPELFTSVVAARRKQSDIAVGNILGSNVFNILCVLGISSLVSPKALPVPPEAFTRDLWVMLGVSLACVPIMLSRGRITRVEGFLLSGLYLLYVAVLYLS